MAYIKKYFSVKKPLVPRVLFKYNTKTNRVMMPGCRGLMCFSHSDMQIIRRGNINLNNCLTGISKLFKDVQEAL